MLNNFPTYPSPYHVTQDDVSPPLQRLEVEKITGHQSLRGGGGVIAVMHEALDWALSPIMGTGDGPPALTTTYLPYWAGTPSQHHKTNRLLHRQMRIGAAQRELFHANRERFLAPGYGRMPRADWLCHYSTTVLPNGVYFCYKADDGLW